MTDREKAIVTAYTGVTMLAGDKFSIFHKYIEDLLGRPVWTHELASESVWAEIKEKSKDDFIELCKTEDIAIEDMQAWNEIKESGMPTLIIEDCAYILDKGCINALLEYVEKQNKKALEEFGDFLKEVKTND